MDALWRMAPRDARGTMTLHDRQIDAETCGQAVVIPASGSSSDSYTTAAEVASRYRAAWLWSRGLAFPPAPGMIVCWGGAEYRVNSVAPLNPDGGAAWCYRLTLAAA